MYKTKINYPKGSDLFGGPMTYTTLGDPYGNSKRKKNPRWNGKQFQTNPAQKRAGMAGGPTGTQTGGKSDGCFSKFLYASEKYTDTGAEYLKTQPLDQRKLGFGSKDAFKVDEFSNTVATRRYRERLDGERKLDELNRKQREQIELERDGKIQGDAAEEKGEEVDTSELGPTLFDFAAQAGKFNQNGIRQPFQECKVGRRKMGNYRVTSSDIGDMCDDVELLDKNKATHGSRNVTKQFYNAGHLGIEEK